MTCYNNCIHYRVCENITDPAMRKIVNGEDIEKHCTAFLELKQGTWVKAECSEKDGDSTCSVCGHWDWSDCNYCSNCGAKMIGV